MKNTSVSTNIAKIQKIITKYISILERNVDFIEETAEIGNKETAISTISKLTDLLLKIFAFHEKTTLDNTEVVSAEDIEIINEYIRKHPHFNDKTDRLI